MERKMTYLKLNGVRHTIFAALMLGVMCQPALADPTTLVCTGWNAAASPSTIALDEAKGQATFHEGDMQIPGGSLVSGRVLGPVAAKFSKETVTFEIHDEGRNSTYTINRLTGARSAEHTS